MFGVRFFFRYACVGLFILKFLFRIHSYAFITTFSLCVCMCVTKRIVLHLIRFWLKFGLESDVHVSIVQLQMHFFNA